MPLIVIRSPAGFDGSGDGSFDVGFDVGFDGGVGAAELSDGAPGDTDDVSDGMVDDVGDGGVMDDEAVVGVALTSAPPCPAQPASTIASTTAGAATTALPTAAARRVPATLPVTGISAP
ncbi:hypothetical protein GCM10025762_42530 [Haloechinothrix salitolerans]